VRVLDLFSGIGGFSLGLERAGMQTVAFCEIEPFPRAVLAKHWPEVPCYEDVRTLTAERLAADGIFVDVICGGFPCQDLSIAGKGAGIGGKRSGLWSEIVRLIGELGPRYVILENVAVLVSRGLADVLGGLASVGYDAEWHCIPAYYVGSPQARDRVWIVAYPVQQGRERRRPCGDWWGKTSERQAGFVDWRSDEKANDKLWPEPSVDRVAYGLSRSVDSINALGNAVVPQIPEIIGQAIMRAAA
jgi:DNA (cytosine-5)-methyltransferase 1